MKRLIYISAVFLAVSSLSVTSTFAQIKKKKIAPQISKVSESEIAEGKGLVAKSDCLACHKVEVKVVGPAYKDVAKKYPAGEANYSLLANKVINGGSGIWGQAPMSAHSSLSVAEARKMVKYILSL